MIKIMKSDLKKFKVLITRKLPEKIEKKLEENFSVLINKTDKKYTYKDLKKKLRM